MAKKPKSGGDEPREIDAQVEGFDPATMATHVGATIVPLTQRARVRTTDRARHVCPVGTFRREWTERTLTEAQIEQLIDDPVPLEIELIAD